MSKKPSPAAKTIPAKKASTPAAPANKSAGKSASKLSTNEVKAKIINTLKSEGKITEPTYIKPAISKQMAEKVEKGPQSTNKTPPKTKGGSEEISKKAVTPAVKTVVKEVLKSAGVTVKPVFAKPAVKKAAAVKKPATKSEVNKALRDQAASGNSLKVAPAPTIKPPVGGLGKNAANDFTRTAATALQGFANTAVAENAILTTAKEVPVYTFEEIERDIQSLETGIASAHGRVGISEGLSVLHGWRTRGAVRFNGLYTDMFKFAIDGSAPNAIRTFIERVNEFVRTKTV